MRYLTVLLWLCVPLATVSAEVFVLADGGRVTGDWLNREQSPRQTYVVRTAEGATITLDAAQVKKILHPRPEEIEYERIRSTYADTAAAQWELAQWCREHKLRSQRELHLRRVVELDSDHLEARRALGYSRVDGRWTTQDEVMKKRGYVRYKGQWRTPQEIKVAEDKRKLEMAQQEWFQKIKRWTGWLGSDRDGQARENLRAIDQPAAVKALALGLRDHNDPRVRFLYVEALAKIDTLEAARAMAIASLFDPVEEVRLTCLDYLERQPRPEIVAYYVGKLKDKKNPVVNMAGFALGRMKDPTTIGPLIDALVTVHKFKIQKQGGDNSISGSFGGGPGQSGGGLSIGKKPTTIRQPMTNQAVLDALIAITGKNFNYDKRAWKYWHASQKKAPKSIDARRGG